MEKLCVRTGGKSDEAQQHGRCARTSDAEAMSLSRLWQQQGTHTEAYALFIPVYGWSTEGFDTADLQEARALLGKLGG